jgi:hypothetical protein
MAGPSQAHLDVLAKQLGFRDYATYSAYQRQQAMMRQAPNVIGQGTTGQAPQRPPVQAQPPQNWLQRLMWGLGGGQ